LCTGSIEELNPNLRPFATHRCPKLMSMNSTLASHAIAARWNYVPVRPVYCLMSAKAKIAG
jgi:hypothetical protein